MAADGSAAVHPGTDQHDPTGMPSTGRNCDDPRHSAIIDPFCLSAPTVDIDNGLQPPHLGRQIGRAQTHVGCKPFPEEPRSS